MVLCTYLSNMSLCCAGFARVQVNTTAIGAKQLLDALDTCFEVTAEVPLGLPEWHAGWHVNTSDCLCCSEGACPLVYVAAGPHEVGLWDIEEGKCHQVGGVHVRCSACACS